jgi:uncharacterized membrane protein YkoI
MTIRTRVFTSAALAFAMVGLLKAQGDKKIEMKDLPPAVQKAVQEQTKGLTVKGLAKEVEDGKTFYEAETTVNGHAKDFLFDTAGKLVAIEEAIALDAVPAAVKTALEAEGKLISVETVTKGKKMNYEGVVEKNGKKTEILVDASGKKVKD